MTPLRAHRNQLLSVLPIYDQSTYNSLYTENN